MNETDLQPTPRSDPAEGEWPARPWLSAAVLALAGLVAWSAADGAGSSEHWRYAIAAAAAFGALAWALIAQPRRLTEHTAFALGVGLVIGGIAWRVAAGEDGHADAGFWLAAGVLAAVIAVPLWQAGVLRDRLRTSYAAVHHHVWTDAICVAGALAFTGLAWALLALLAVLFDLVGIGLLSDLIDEGWFGWSFSGAAFGAGLGTLREQAKVLGTLRHVVQLVLVILAVPLALALLLFLAAMLVTGPQVLWNATDSATPVLLACAVGAFVLGNAVLRDDDAEWTASHVLRLAALVLVLAILPLALFAAISTGARIAQHGLSPERIWALIAVVVGTMYGLAYWVAAARGRLGPGSWRGGVRQANLHLAMLTCGLALLLALPLIDFGAVATRNQLARLESGAVPANEFDFDALRWDFGDAGRAALARLARSDDAAIVREARIARARDYRPPNRATVDDPTRERRLANLRMEFDDPASRRAMSEYVASSQWQCEQACVALAIAPPMDGIRDFVLLNQPGGWQRLYLPLEPRDPAAVPTVEPAAPPPPPPVMKLDEDAEVEIRIVERRQVFVDGTPIGDAFD